MKKRVNTTMVSAMIMLLFSVVTWFAIPYNIGEPVSAADIGPRAFPQLICGIIAILSFIKIILMVTGVQKGKYKEINLAAQGRVYFAMAMAVVAVLLAKFVNIVVSGVVCALLFLVLLRVRNWRYYVAVIVTGGLLFVLMKFVMSIKF